AGRRQAAARQLARPCQAGGARRPQAARRRQGRRTQEDRGQGTRQEHQRGPGPRPRGEVAAAMRPAGSTAALTALALSACAAAPPPPPPPPAAPVDTAPAAPLPGGCSIP